jgi:Uri superfamily endonuclease
MNQYIMKQGKGEIPVMGFGASDCKKNCGSHLLYFGDAEIITKIVGFYREKMGSRFVIIYTPPN